MLLVTSFLVSTNFILFLNAKEGIVVKTKSGDVRGTTMKSVDGDEYNAFIGIPYAESPLGEMRFTAPTPKKPWTENGIFEATKDGAVCIQIDLLSKSVVGSEDCLFLNVYTKKISPEKKYPVMVWIHGGGFMVGHSSSWFFGPSRFIAEDVIVVSFNYRLGPLGFLSTGEETSPGNYGLLDQVEALKWIKENINAFGGDENQITIFGQSAGSASVLYHIQSSMTKGLFHRAISMSGSPMCFWGFQKNPQFWARKLGKSLKCPGKNNVELIDCLRRLPATDLIKASHLFIQEVMIAFPPVLDGNFISEEPQKVFKEGKFESKVPILMGTVKDEGSGVYYLLGGKLFKYSEDLLKLRIRQTINYEEDIPCVFDLIKENYLQNCDFSDKVRFAEAASKFIGDGTLNICSLQTAKLLADAGFETQFYNFDFSANYSFLNLMGYNEYRGVSHGDELWYLFDGRLFSNFMRNDRVKKMAVKFVKLFANFAKFGDATKDEDVKWPLSTSENVFVYHIDEESHVEKYDLEGDPKSEFWLKKILQCKRNVEELKFKGEL